MDPELRTTYLGHSSVEFEAGGSRLLADPLLRPSLFGALRRRRPLPAVETERIDGVLISHAHHDHLDLPTLRRLPRTTPFFVPRGVGGLIAKQGFGEVTELGVAERVELAGISITATATDHSAARRSGAAGGECVGFLVEHGGASAYFAGDTALFDGMREIAETLDLALMPIGGWGPKLGPGHLDPEQAALALALLEPRMAVPVHWGTYTPLGAPRLWPWMTEAPARRFAEHAASHAPATEVRVLEPGEQVVVSAPK